MPPAVGGFDLDLAPAQPALQLAGEGMAAVVGNGHGHGRPTTGVGRSV